MINNDQVMSLYKEGKTDGEIAELVGERKKNIQGWRYRNKLKTNGEEKTVGRKYVVDEEMALELYMGGMSDKEISKEFGCSPESVRRWRELNEYPTNQPIFTWQRLLKPSRFERIPERYRDPKLWAVAQ